MINDLFANRVLLTAMAAWLIGQFSKLPGYYLLHHKWKWAIIFSPGGFPSSHSCLMTATTLSIGLFHGFGTPLFGLAVAVSMIVIYDATGVRRQAGLHARMINEIVQEIFAGQPIPQKQLREVLGHTPIEAIAGIILGIAIAVAIWILFPVFQ
jgi:acid phosphatase family membrane protein YuiD